MRPKIKAPIVTMTAPKMTNPCQLEQRGSKEQFRNCPGEVEESKGGTAAHLAERLSVSESLAWIKHRPVGFRDTKKTFV